MPTDVLDVTQRFMREPIRILVKKEELTLEGIRQFYINITKDVGAICILDSFSSVFCREWCILQQKVTYPDALELCE